jgi:hypothetical protein
VRVRLGDNMERVYSDAALITQEASSTSFTDELQGSPTVSVQRSARLRSRLRSLA